MNRRRFLAGVCASALLALSRFYPSTPSITTETRNLGYVRYLEIDESRLHEISEQLTPGWREAVLHGFGHTSDYEGIAQIEEGVVVEVARPAPGKQMRVVGGVLVEDPRPAPVRVVVLTDDETLPLAPELQQRFIEAAYG